MVRVFIALAFAVSLPQALAQACPVIEPLHTPVFADGYSGRVIKSGQLLPRGIIFDRQGNILTAEQGGYGVRYIQLNDNGGTNVCVGFEKQLIADSTINHGITLSLNGRKLFVSSATTVWSWDYDGRNGTVSNRKTLIDIPVQEDHVSRTLLIPRSSPGTLIVSRGSGANIDNGTLDINSGRSQIRAFNIAQIENTTVPYNAGKVVGWGLRNSVGVAEHPVSGLWSVENSADQLNRSRTDIHNTNPSEELNYHGHLRNPYNRLLGANYGYPDCLTVYDPSVFPAPLNTQLHPNDQFVHDQAPGNDTDATCAHYHKAPRLSLPPHTAPLDLKFNKKGTAAYIPFHGSWNRSPPDGYRLSRINFSPFTGQPLEPSTSINSTINIMYNPDNAACPDGCFRPVNVAFGPNGQLFMTSDTTNETWVITGPFH